MHNFVRKLRMHTDLLTSTLENFIGSSWFRARLRVGRLPPRLSDPRRPKRDAPRSSAKRKAVDKGVPHGLACGFSSKGPEGRPDPAGSVPPPPSTPALACRRWVIARAASLFPLSPNPRRATPPAWWASVIQLDHGQQGGARPALALGLERRGPMLGPMLGPDGRTGKGVPSHQTMGLRGGARRGGASHLRGAARRLLYSGPSCTAGPGWLAGLLRCVEEEGGVGHLVIN